MQEEMVVAHLETRVPMVRTRLLINHLSVEETIFLRFLHHLVVEFLINHLFGVLSCLFNHLMVAAWAVIQEEVVEMVALGPEDLLAIIYLEVLVEIQVVVVVVIMVLEAITIFQIYGPHLRHNLTGNSSTMQCLHGTETQM
ncbi:hypothetical protein B0H13DRAFT_2342079 [Mycena leptocephala]|nr:hypothetical protein B0H13DRAFT_2342079 [Mycena leptocephala]